MCFPHNLPSFSRTSTTEAPHGVLEGHRGTVNAAVFSADGDTLVTAGGIPGEFGEVKVWHAPPLADG